MTYPSNAAHVSSSRNNLDFCGYIDIYYTSQISCSSFSINQSILYLVGVVAKRPVWYMTAEFLLEYTSQNETFHKVNVSAVVYLLKCFLYLEFYSG